MKDFIRDNGKVRECISNNAKMNLLEWMWYRKEIIPRILKDAFQNIFEGIHLLVYGIINLITVLLLPITYPIAAFVSIRRAKKEMEKREKYKRG